MLIYATLPKFHTESLADFYKICTNALLLFLWYAATDGLKEKSMCINSQKTDIALYLCFRWRNMWKATLKSCWNTPYRFDMWQWWRHQMETFSALMPICAGNSPVTGEFPTERPGTRIFDIFFDQRLNKRLSKQCWGSWFETPSRPLWRHCNDNIFQGDNSMNVLYQKDENATVFVCVSKMPLWMCSR